jgi:phosphatidylserine/phosphatidylglycerophosphate/cardiolipin synthase-like enzyme
MSSVPLGEATVRAWFCPGRGDALAHRIAATIGRARRRVRIASPVITSGPVLGTLAELTADARVDVAGVIDATQIEEVYGQWRENARSRWKLTLLAAVLGAARFTGKRSTPYRPGSVHDYMHAKVTVADDVVFVGSFNLSHSGELNAENVLEIADPTTADALATFIDSVRARYPPAPLP